MFIDKIAACNTLCYFTIFTLFIAHGFSKRIMVIVKGNTITNMHNVQ